MANNMCFTLVLLVCFGLVFDGAARTQIQLRSSSVIDLRSLLQSPVPAPHPEPAPPLAPSPGSSADGICKSRVEIFGYECEEHTRIPNGRTGGPSGESKTPVLLQHGLLMDGTTWLLDSPDQSLGYILADNGYDVWIANTRGTIYSQGHTSLSSDNQDYWDWSWDELVAYDLPATFNYVYTQTGQQKLHYVGHSLGTLIALASFSQQDLLSMLRSAALLSPIAYMDQLTSPIAHGGADSFLAETVYWLGLDEFNPISRSPTTRHDTSSLEVGIMSCRDLFCVDTAVWTATGYLTSHFDSGHSFDFASD